MASLICPCDVFVHPRVPWNPPGRDVIEVRVGDYTSFRHALLLSRPGEIELSRWHPAESGDLGLQLLEWWAYLADVLTFYNERAATEAYLRTALLAESPRRLVRLLGYRPRPGIGATATLAAILSPPGNATAPPRSITLPAGFQVQSKPGPGEQPQIFELDAATTIAPPDAVPADPPPDDGLKGKSSVLLTGTVTSVKEDDHLLLLSKGWTSASSGWALIKVLGLTPEKDPRGKAATRLAFELIVDELPAGATTSGYRLLRATQTAHPWLFLAGAPALGSTAAHLEGVSRAVRVGDPVLFEGTGGGLTMTQISKLAAKQVQLGWKQSVYAKWQGLGIQAKSPAQSAATLLRSSAVLVRVTSYSETAWYANGTASAPQTPPASPTPAIPILHSVLGYASNADVAALAESTTTVSFAWVEVAPLMATAAPSMTEAVTTLTAVAPATFEIGNGQPVLLEDNAGLGVAATLSTTDGVTATLAYAAETTFTLLAPLKVHFGLLPASRGETVPEEILGSGDPAQANQVMTLSKSPLTYLPDTSPDTPGYKSTLTVRVDGVAWTEVQSFYGQAADARVYTTREDDAGLTSVRFGDGVNGARLTAGSGNVTALYRRGSGAAAPAAGAITSVLKPWPGLKSIRNPVAAGGGSDPDPPEQLRKLAPRSVLTFDRAVSGDDWETLAAAAPGVARARAYWTWNPQLQRTLVTVYVGDDAQAVANAFTALASYADPNRPKVVLPAKPLDATLSLTVLYDAAYAPDAIIAAVRTALLDEDTGLFGTTRARIGEAIYESEIHDVCLDVAGAVAVHALAFSAPGLLGPGPRFAPGEGEYFKLAAEDLLVSAEVANG